MADLQPSTAVTLPQEAPLMDDNNANNQLSYDDDENDRKLDIDMNKTFDNDDDDDETVSMINLEEDAPLMDVLEEFSQGTSIHGLPYLFDFKHYTFRKRQIWCPMILLSTALMLTQAIQLIVQYHSFDVNVNVHQTFPAELDFPQVTVCNMNMYNHALQNQTGIFQPKNEEELHMISTPLEEFIYRTSFNTDINHHTAPTVEEAWKPVITPYGLCFEFQTNETIIQPGFSNNFAGGAGLTLLLNIHQEQYDANASATAGVRLFIAEKGKHVSHNQRNVLVPPGVEALVGLRRAEYDREPRDPWSQCLMGVPKYYQSVCRSECMRFFIRRQCNCRELGDTTNSTNLPYCTDVDRSNCTAFRMSPRTQLPLCNCDKPACFEDSFESDLTKAPFAEMYLRSMASDYRPQILASNPALEQNNVSDSQVEKLFRQYAQGNFILIKINYEMIRLDVVTEDIAMTFASLMSQLGGLMGLYLGVSVISLVELFGELVSLRLIPRLWGDRRLYGIGSR